VLEPPLAALGREAVVPEAAAVDGGAVVGEADGGGGAELGRDAGDAAVGVEVLALAVGGEGLERGGGVVVVRAARR
jgi:hypothetical protein